MLLLINYSIKKRFREISIITNIFRKAITENINSEYNQIRDTQAQVLDESSFVEYLEKGKVYFIGNGVEKTKELILHPNAIFVENKLPSANEMSKLAYSKYKKNDIEDIAYFEPYYLKDFIALKPKG